MKKLWVFILAVMILVSFYYFYNHKPWMLSLYRGGSTILRLDYASKQSCLSAGSSYMVDKRADRFDCGYKCSIADKSKLDDSPICNQVCNGAGCR